jgi:hypothetical protein
MSAHASEAPPLALPELPWTAVPDSHRHVSRWLQDLQLGPGSRGRNR